ncbi:MAG: isoleucine--tRNA ligase [Solirubrobacteraceae bacterium]
MRFPVVDPRQSFPDLEQGVLTRWRERDVFAESVRRREGGTPYVFYEGPPTANGRPGSHHVLARVFKDIYPRYKTMQGHHVLRKGGWDCHGLPVEIAVESKLGFKDKNDIEAYGIAEFNAECRGSVLEFLEDWKALTERIGFWVDLDSAYATMDTPFVESVWWALAQLHERDLLYEGHKVVPYCTRCGTALSSHEVSLGYKDVEDPSVYVKFPLVDGTASLLIWTTTPWTLVSNAAVAVDPALSYVRASLAGEVFILAEALVERVLGEDVEILDRFPGEHLVGVRYEPPFPYLAASEWGARGHTVLPGDFVSDEDGTGIVHTAIAFGEDDFRLGAEQGLAVVNPVRRDGTYDERIGPYAGRWVKDADDDLVEDLRARGKLFRAERYLHSYPHCWRDGTPLLYYAKPSWFVRTTALREDLLAANESVTWHPPHIKHGRFGKWLENNVDWAISRERYWGTPLPIWRNEAGETVAVSSLADLAEKSGVTLDDPHRPYVDDVEIPSPTGGEPLRRTPEVIDVWFDSGSMPFAQWGAPHTGQADFERDFPADYVCEALDQTRGWFYSLLAVNTLLFGRAPYKDVVCLGLILDEQGEKMSKSKGNIVAPWEVLDAYGADALRWYFFTSKHPWDGYQFSVDAVGESLRQFLLQLWNTYGFYTLYANAAGDEYARAEPATPLDRWAISRLNATVATVTDGLERYDATTAGRAIAAFVDDLSNWYVRLSRRRFWDGDPAAFATLHECLVTVAKLLAPFCPFVADELYEGLDGSEPSVHLCDWPAPGDGLSSLIRPTPAPAAPGEEILVAMELARATVEMGRSARAHARVKNRQPLGAMVIVASGAERDALEGLADLLRDELNVKELRFVSETAQLGSYEVKANYRTLGPRFGKQMPQVAAAVAALDAAHVATALREGRTVGVHVDGHDHELGPDDLQLAMQPLEGYQVERAGSHAVALDLQLTDELRREGLARELVHAIQNERRTAGLDVSDRIHLTLAGDEETLAAARAHEAYIAGEVLATSVTLEEGDELRIEIEKA